MTWEPVTPAVGSQPITPRMVETRDLVQLRQLNLELLRQLRAGQDAVRRAVAKAASEVSTLAKSLGKGESSPLGSSRVSILLMRKTEAWCGTGLAWDPAEAGARMTTRPLCLVQAIWLCTWATWPLYSSQARTPAAAATQRYHPPRRRQ